MVKAEKVVRKIASKVHWKGDVATQQTYRRYYASCHTDFNWWSSWSEEHRKWWVNFVKVTRAKLKWVSRLRVWWSVLCISNQMISLNAWIFRKRKGFCWLHGLIKTNLVKTTFLSIHAAVVGSYLRNSSQCSKQRQKAGFFMNSEQIFSSKCSLPWYV